MMNSEFMAFTSDVAASDVLRRYAERQGYAADVVRDGGADLFAALLESEPPPRVALVDLDHQDNAATMAGRLAGLCGKNTRLVGMGSTNDVGYYRAIVGAGFADYLVKPLMLDPLTQALAQAARGAGGGQESKIVVFIGTRGGVGTTTVAANVAWILAHEHKQKTVLVDLDLQFGNTALLLDLDPGRGLRDIVSAPQRVDALMISGVVVTESPELALIGAEEQLDDFVHVDNAAISTLLRELKPTYKNILVDLPRHLLTTQKKLLAMAQEVVLVTEMSLVGIRDTLRIEALLKGAGATARTLVVATGAGPGRVAPVDEASFTKGTKGKIDITLPDDHKNVTAATNAGKMLPVIAGNAALTRALRDLARALGGDPAAAQAKGKGFFGLFAKHDTKGDA